MHGYKRIMVPREGKETKVNRASDSSSKEGSSAWEEDEEAGEKETSILSKNNLSLGANKVKEKKRIWFVSFSGKIHIFYF